MCLVTFFYQIIIVGMVLLVIYSYRWMFKTSEENFEILSGLLESPAVKSWYLVRSLEGYYKGRKITLCYFIGDNNSNNFLGPSIEPKYILRKQKFFCLNYPKPTKNTVLMNNKIYYNSLRSPFKNLDWLWQSIRSFSAEELTGALEELTQAAEIVEKSPEPTNFKTVSR